MAFQIPSTSKDAYKNSLFPQTIRNWNDLSDSLISSAELLDDCLSLLLLRELRTNFPQSQPLVNDCHFGISPVNYSDSEGLYYLCSEKKGTD